MLKVAIVGCGKIADAHASQILRIGGCEIVGVCDREPLMAQQLYDRFPIQRSFSDVDALLERARPDVVHITTPPESHFDLARQCLDGGCHVYVEKPVALHATEVEALIQLAQRKGLKLTAGHDDQFSHAARRMRALVQQGYLGGRPVHLESYYCYDLSEPGYARALLGDRKHWVRRLPGRLLHNIISHGIARIAEFLDTDCPRVIAHGAVSPLLTRMGETDIVDELRAIVSEDGGPTAYFTFSSQMRPSLHQFRIYGPKNGLLLDQDHETVIALRGRRYTSYVDKFVPPVNIARQYMANVVTNARTFLARDFHMKSGMKYLIEAFYRSIVDDGPVPISYGEILRVARIMDAIFKQLDEQRDRAIGEQTLQLVSHR
jgi:predicted dehydrogenase